MALQYGPSSLPIRSGSSTAGTLGLPGYSGAFQAPALKAKPKKSPVSQTLAQVAQQRVQAQIGPQVAAQQAFAAQQNQAIQGFAQALLGKLQPIAGQVGQAYDQAISQQGALSGQAANFLSQANPTGQVAELLRSAGAPQSQQDQLAAQLGQTFTGGAGVLAFQGGTVPGGQLAAEKAAMQGQAAQLPGLAALKGQQDLASALWQQGQDRRELEATRPALYQAAAQDIRQNNAARAAAGATARYRADTLKQNWAKFTIQEGDSQKAAAEKTREFNAKLESANAKALIDSYVQLTKLGYTQDQIELQINKLAGDQAAETTRLQIAQQNANTSSQNANTSQARATRAAAPTYDASRSRSLGFRADQYGQPVGGTYTPLPGFKQKPGAPPGTMVKISSANQTTASGGKFSNSDVASLAGDLQKWHSGVTGTQNGQNVVDPSSQLTWNDAYTRALTRLPSTKAGRTKALSLVNAEYGTPDSIALGVVRSDRNGGSDFHQAVKHVFEAVSAGALPVPMQYAVDAISRLYGVQKAAVRAALDQYRQLAESGQVSGG